MIFEDADSDPVDFGTGIAIRMLDHFEAHDNADVCAIRAGLVFFVRLDAANLAIDPELFGPDIGLAFFERGQFFIVSHARHNRASCESS